MLQVRKAYRVYQLGGAISEILYSPAAYGLDMSVRNMPRPKGRIAAQVRQGRGIRRCVSPRYDLAVHVCAQAGACRAPHARFVTPLISPRRVIHARALNAPRHAWRHTCWKRSVHIIRDQVYS